MSQLGQRSLRPCACSRTHVVRRVVLTGGPGVGKTAVLELCKRLFCQHVVILPEAASLLFAGGFPRDGAVPERAATQRAIYHVQRELEAVAEAQDNAAILLCERGTLDAAAYWPGPDSFYAAVASSHEAELARYAAVVHLRAGVTPPDQLGDSARVEAVHEAATIDAAIAAVWRGHPRYVSVERQPNIMAKAALAIANVRAQLPACCG